MTARSTFPDHPPQNPGVEADDDAEVVIEVWDDEEDEICGYREWVWETS